MSIGCFTSIAAKGRGESPQRSDSPDYAWTRADSVTPTISSSESRTTIEHLHTQSSSCSRDARGVRPRVAVQVPTQCSRGKRRVEAPSDEKHETLLPSGRRTPGTIFRSASLVKNGSIERLTDDRHNSAALQSTIRAGQGYLSAATLLIPQPAMRAGNHNLRQC